MAAHIYCMISDRSVLTLKNPKTVTGKEMRKSTLTHCRLQGARKASPR